MKLVGLAENLQNSWHDC